MIHKKHHIIGVEVHPTGVSIHHVHDDISVSFSSVSSFRSIRSLVRPKTCESLHICFKIISPAANAHKTIFG